MLSLLLSYDQVRSLNESDPRNAQSQALTKGWPILVVAMLAIVRDWRGNLPTFQRLCEVIAADESLSVEWRALAAEHLAGSTPETDTETRMQRNFASRELALQLPEGDDRDYLLSALKVGCQETPGATPNHELFMQQLDWQIDHGVRHAPGRAVAAIALFDMEDADALTLLDRVVDRQQTPGCNFTPGQMRPVTEAIARLRPSS